MAQSAKDNLMAALSTPVIVDVSWDGGREILKIPGSDVQYKEFDSEIIPD